MYLEAERSFDNTLSGEGDSRSMFRSRIRKI